MRSGSEYGGEGRAPRAPVLSIFRDSEDGFTTVAVAVSLVLSLTLVFASASVLWVGGRSSEVQRVADASAMAGQNAVSAFSTVVQVLDACALSMGLTGVIVFGAGLVVSCVPGLSAVGAQITGAGGRILEARRSFVRSAADGVEKLEATLPLLIVANSASCVAANSQGGISYTGCALPFPAESASDFSALRADVDDERLEDLSEKMREASDEQARAQERADEAKERGWRADCVPSPYCMRERAASLAGLSGAANPDYPSVDGWTFAAPLLRARNYYAARLSSATVGGSTAEEITDSACRRAFYEYALDQVRGGSYVENADGSVSIDLPSLPRNADQTRATELYTRSMWPCTVEDGARTLHSSLLCPGATGAGSGTASLAELEAGALSPCKECRMDIGDMGRVASASTSIANGFEHHWRDVVEASEDYEQAKREEAEAKRRAQELAEEGEDAFGEEMERLAAERPELCPPGAWGCVSVVARGEAHAVPAELTSSFLSSAELPEGAAVSAAALAPDESTAENNVLSRFFDSLTASGSVMGGVLDGVMDLWGSLLVGYGSAYGSVAEAGGEFLDGLDGVLGGTVGSWLRGRLKQVMQDMGFEPVDMRLRKPVLTNTQDVLEQSGFEQLSTVRSLVRALPASGTSAEDFARSVGYWLSDETGGEFTVAELAIPGTEISIPLTIDLEALGAGS
ncbi:hypothetical protein B5F79_01870 [Olsenella sp. An285]|uniref:hypothetical protein n=1 Tax=Olsenella sp. An285 TaxID=1965621 RepID=UPI000B3A123E|nr:hypothetical protein [Olsenella sp. An285]OUO48121.1 hypothetical protein B5F79_01870 [Olsenella sp. An285]